MENLINEISGYIGIFQVLIGGILGFLGGIVSTWFLQRRQMKIDRENLSSTLAGEIGAIISIIETRGFEREIRDTLKRIRDGELIKFTRPIRRNYTQVYEHNVVKLGILDKTLAMQIVTFYTQINALLEDNQEMGEIDVTTCDLKYLVDRHEEMLELLTNNVELGKEIKKKLDIPASRKDEIDSNITDKRLPPT